MVNKQPPTTPLIKNYNAQYNKNDLMAIIIYGTHYILGYTQVTYSNAEQL